MAKPIRRSHLEKSSKKQLKFLKIHLKVNSMENKEERLRVALNLTYVLIDICDSYALEVETLLKHNKMYRNSDKMLINRMRSTTGQLVKSVDKVLNNEQTSEDFGHDSDFLREVIEIAIQTEDERDEIKLLSSMKLAIKPKKD